MTNKFEASTLILRVVLGFSFFMHGLAKFRGGIENTVGWFDSIGLPGVLAYVVAAIELIGGIALVVGLGTRIVSGLLAILMAGAILKVKLSLGFLGNGQMAGYELDVIFLAVSLFLVINGSKMYAADQLIQNGFKNTSGENSQAA